MANTDLTARECKQARQGLDWSRDRLAEAAQVGKRTIIDFENEVRQPIEATKIALKNALENAGVVFRGDRITIPVKHSTKGAE